MPRSTRPVLALLQVVLLLGCGATSPVPLGPPPPSPLAAAVRVRRPAAEAIEPTPVAARVRAGEPAAPGRRLLCDDCGAPASGSSEGVPACAECGCEVFRDAFSPPFVPELDLGRVQGRVAALFAERGSFERVTTPGEAGGARGAPSPWVLEVSLRDARLELLEHNGLYPLKVSLLIVQSILIFPGVDPVNWVLPSEVYGVSTRARWRLTHAETGARRAGEVTATTADAFAAFNPFGPGRAWFLVGFVRVPDCLGPAEWAGIAGQLRERAEDDLARALVAAAEEAVKDAGE